MKPTHSLEAGFFELASVSTASSYSEEAAAVVVCISSAPSSNDTQQALGAVRRSPQWFAGVRGVPFAEKR